MTKMENLQSTISISTLAFIFLLFITITNQPSSARTLINSHHHHNHHKITFLMTNLLNLTHPSPKPATSKLTHDHQLPFSKPIGLFPPTGGVHIPETNPSTPTSGSSSSSSSSSQTLDLSGIGFSFPARATLQELEFGIVTVIEEEVYEANLKGGFFQKLGRAQGMYVASSENGSSHMMAMMVSFGNGDDDGEDGLRFFGVHRTDVIESHIAVIGGTGKFNGANGYATVKAMSVKSNSNASGEEEQADGTRKLLKFNVYLS
ncbi:hypothetical protein FEM48_Zijuj03G0078100 [Ziziphus jujuba var. spinosa]|uniref:Dirigent protein n=1 Tax=Ziziphus jujuba var. spinosa TaxID=714518 RepID=A0A978VP25_ZIZJJ|nr:hypothetical protein FEM48_Zijuj03G0078100 [Ziziphus jujuba var. spinosa]